MKKIFNDNSGVSLIVATIFVSVMMLVAAGLAQVTIATIRNIGDFNFSEMTQYLAFGSSQIAGQFANDKPVGENVKIDGSNATYAEMDDYIKFLEKFGVECGKQCVGFRVVGSAETNAQVKVSGLNTSFYSVPAAYKDDKGNLKSTGSAAEECADPENADDPCHWN
ncbi:hypothetical protein HZC21_03385, partial [Candidatus Peregrinibacteria bacterium]|nr:hypothetical protein [Candidatus Peregrinibacteria bacterium]